MEAAKKWALLQWLLAPPYPLLNRLLLSVHSCRKTGPVRPPPPPSFQTGLRGRGGGRGTGINNRFQISAGVLALNDGIALADRSVGASWVIKSIAEFVPRTKAI